MGDRRLLAVVLLIVGVALIVVGIIYFAEPAHSLPGFFPGHQAGVVAKHTKHGIVAVVLGVVVLIGAWFAAGSKSSKKF